MNKKTNLVIFIKIETSGLPLKKSGYDSSFYKFTELDKYDSSRLIGISWSICDFKGNQQTLRHYYIKPNGFSVTNSDIHGITQKFLEKKGVDIKQVFNQLETDLVDNIKVLVAHNMEFDYNIVMSEIHRLGNKNQLINKMEKLEKACTAQQTRDILKLPTKSVYGNSYKLPKLSELYEWCFKKTLTNDHDLENNVIHLRDIFFHLLKN